MALLLERLFRKFVQCFHVLKYINPTFKITLTLRFLLTEIRKLEIFNLLVSVLFFAAKVIKAETSISFQ